MNKLNVLWITADYFIDVDFLLVPYIKKCFDLNIDWYFLKGKGSNIQIPENLDINTISLRYGDRDPRSYFELYFKIRKLHPSKYDIIYSDVVGTWKYHFFLLRFAKLIPVVHAAHNVIPYNGWSDVLTNSVRYIFKHHRYFQLFSKFTAQYFREHYPSKSMFYCPMTLKGYGDVSTDHYQVDNNKINLLFFGNMVANKRLDILIKAMRSLPESVNEKIHLTIAGNDRGHAKEYLKLIGNASNISTDFRRIPDEEVAELFTKHDFLVLPYEDVAQSGPHMVAYYYDLPVIASDIQGFSERIIDGVNGFVFRKNDVHGLAKVLEYVSKQSKSDYLKMKQNLKSYAQENFCLESVSRKYIEYFHKITINHELKK